MLFLIRTEIEHMPNMDRDTFMSMVKDQWNYVLDLKKKGKILEAYRLSGRKGGIAIAKVESHGELNRIMSNMPLFPWFATEAIPIIPLEKSL
ncbi:MAG: muconolactone delta-isomerase [Methanobacteriota archaeon]|nr:MAG: muconolactone delta-isomerase [Euryarchaeota archaeon]